MASQTIKNIRKQPLIKLLPAPQKSDIKWRRRIHYHFEGRFVFLVEQINLNKISLREREANLWVREGSAAISNQHHTPSWGNKK
jgi:hypothetical protein